MRWLMERTAPPVPHAPQPPAANPCSRPARPGQGRVAGLLLTGILLLAAGAWAVGAFFGGRRPASVALPGSPAIVPAAPGAAHPGDVLPVVGNPAPDFALEDLSGRTVRLGELKGRPVLINFWATWCPPCLKEIPEIQRFYARYRGQLEVLGVDVAEPRERVEAFVRRGGYSWTFLLDTHGRVTEQYLVMGLPTSFFLDAGGIVRARHIGPMTYEQMEQYAALAGLPAAPGESRPPATGASSP